MLAILGFEPKRAMPNGLANHRTGLSYAISKYFFKLKYLEFFIEFSKVFAMDRVLVELKQKQRSHNV